MKKLFSLLIALCLCMGLCGSLIDTAYAGDLDYIRQYDVTVTPQVDDGSLRIQLDFQWEVLEQGPVTWLQIGIPNGSIRDVEALTDNIASLDFDNSFMYVYFDRGYDDGEVIHFSYAWTQEYMYTRDEHSGVSYHYTPGWFDEARIGKMTLTWNSPAEASPGNFSASQHNGTWEGYSDGNAVQYVGEDLNHGAQLSLEVIYAIWPTQLSWEGSSENLPEDDWYYEDDYYYEDDSDDIFALFVLIVLIVVVVLVLASIQEASDGYNGGFGTTTHYVQWHGLWYPAGPDGRPRPNSVGTKTKPAAPPRGSSSRRSGGFGGGSRGGGFGGGGFGGGGHCACASSCACACACACAGGGRAGCSAKNLYGAVQLNCSLTTQLTEK